MEAWWYKRIYEHSFSQKILILQFADLLLDHRIDKNQLSNDKRAIIKDIIMQKETHLFENKGRFSTSNRN